MEEERLQRRGGRGEEKARQRGRGCDAGGEKRQARRGEEGASRGGEEQEKRKKWVKTKKRYAEREPFIDRKVSTIHNMICPFIAPQA